MKKKETHYNTQNQTNLLRAKQEMTKRKYIKNEMEKLIGRNMDLRCLRSNLGK